MYLTLGSHILSRSMEADILESKKDLYLVPGVWRPIFWKVKRIYILFQKYGGRYFEIVLFINLFYFEVSICIAMHTIVKYVPFIIKTT